MNERFAHYRERLVQFWGQMGKKQKLWLGASISGLLLTVILLTIVFTRTEYELAFQNMDATDAAAVMAYLDGNGIPYELNNNGTSISVPSAVASRVKVDVGSQGLVQNGSIGFEIFTSNSTQFGDTENVFDVKYQSALNGEVQKLLNGLQGVESTKVLINRPEDSVFLTTEEEPTAKAAIVMQFMPGYRPSQKAIDSYYNLVKATVADLAIEDITISSAQGELISSEAEGAATSNADAVEMQFQIQSKYETGLKNEIQQFLGRIVGSDNLVVSITSSMNFERWETEENLVQPLENNDNNGIKVSEETNNSISTGSQSPAGGVAGTGETDIPGYEAGSQGSNSSETNSQIINWDYNRIKKFIESAPYALDDLSISIGIEASQLNDENARTDIMNYLTSVVRSQLAGSSQDVNDDNVIGKKVSLIASNFAENPSAASNSGLSTPWAIGLGAAALAVIGGLVFMMNRRRKLAAVEEVEMTPASTKVEYPTLDLDSVNNESQARKNLETLAKRKPDEFVNLLRTWLVDE
ncbi:flagellar basal-body MS-ring/collar protein FliF [Paenibacillus sp. LHD-117]|uniref:flagellar basal-body MS-ring/collar protein FliF n=1 Tax=Paenibacillus sp. LHD-117 TaxID=3071412 RepID=UPI0027E0B7A6|nr:flagellar basal-body MS-ring/collar protein FliF [Paenibacillus sp. LHD-117]MDQ6419261.1 flagellar basal-body MS-ring/collar protein FliF [Paenibacillus sp. LHD-117]